jgi:hypothetical protein
MGQTLITLTVGNALRQNSAQRTRPSEDDVRLTRGAAIARHRLRGADQEVRNIQRRSKSSCNDVTLARTAGRL